MNDSYPRLYELLHRYHHGSSSAHEIDELMRLINESRNDEALSEALRAIWEELKTEDPIFSQSDFNRILNGIVQPDSYNLTEPVPLRTFPWIRYAAAAVLLLVGIATFWKLNHQDISTDPLVIQTPTSISPGGNKATLTLSDGSSILLDSAKTGILAQEGPTDILKTNDGQLKYDTKNVTNSLPESQINTLTTPKGGQYRIVLPDGSQAWLNAASSIRFPARFAPYERAVSITGEVYFEVKKDAHRPFKVRFLDSEIEVLGTSFNVMAYPDETTPQTTLVEGSVRIRNQKEEKKLRPGQQAFLHTNGQLDIKSVDTEEITAWKKGLFYFTEADIPAVMKQIGRWYDIEVSYEGKLPDKQFTGKVSRTIQISALLDMLHYAGVNYRIEGRKVTITQ